MTKPLSQFTSKELEQIAGVCLSAADARKKSIESIEECIKAGLLPVTERITAVKYQLEADKLLDAGNILLDAATKKGRAAA